MELVVVTQGFYKSEWGLKFDFSWRHLLENEWRGGSKNKMNFGAEESRSVTSTSRVEDLGWTWCLS